MSTLRKTLYILLVCLLATDFSSRTTKAQDSPELEHILIEANGAGDRIRDAIRSQGGKVTAELKYADALAADVPSDSIDKIRNIAGPSSISKDVRILGPRTVTSGGIRNVNSTQVGPVV